MDAPVWITLALTLKVATWATAINLVAPAVKVKMVEMHLVL